MIAIEKAQGLFPNYYGMGDFYLLPRSGVYDIEASILNGTFPYKARTVFTNPSNLTTFLVSEEVHFLDMPLTCERAMLPFFS